jgi:hypothetical protein
MPTVIISPFNVVNFLEGGGHFWVYMQYAQGLRQLGCEVYWLENFRSSGNGHQDAAMLSTFRTRMEPYGLSEKLILYLSRGQTGASGASNEYVTMSRSKAEALFRQADLLLNFHYTMEPALLSCFRRTALVDIDPGLLQFWISRRQLTVYRHDCYFTTGETVGTSAALFPDCGLPWIHIRPAVCLDRWPYAYDPQAEAFTTVSSWSADDWIVDGTQAYENTKRKSFLQFAELPHRTPLVLELALFLGISEDDAKDRRLMERHGWRIRHSREVARTPEMYKSYIQGARGEFSCAKPSCAKFQNAWMSDRTLCYLASGKPVVVQNTGPSSFLPNGEGMFRFSTLGEAADALAAINTDYERHCRAARQIAEAYFDARPVAERILNFALQ